MTLSNSHEVIKKITTSLFTAEERRLGKVRESLIVANKEFYRDRPHDGFTYSGKPYDPVGLTRGARTRVPLHVDMTGRMEAYLSDLEQVWTDRHYISQILFTILQPCDSLQDIRDALPNCLVDTLDSVKRLPRVREEAYTIQNNTMTLRQYRKVLPRIHFYSATGLLY